MLRLKSCGRCLGDMFSESSSDGFEWVCVQCGYREDEAARAGPIGVDRMLRNAVRLHWEASNGKFDRAVDADLASTSREAA
jgi:hypothetical protein